MEGGADGLSFQPVKSEFEMKGEKGGEKTKASFHG